MKRKIHINTTPLRILPALTGFSVCIAGLLIYPQSTAAGIKNGILLLGNNIIPSLFPFMVLSSYIAGSRAVKLLATLIHKPADFLLKISGNGMIAVILGTVGGYPVGAKTVAEMRRDDRITAKEASRLIFWCVNPGPAFVITAIGTFMLGSTSSGIILYTSNILASLSLGIFFRFFNNHVSDNTPPPGKEYRTTNILIKSVASGSEAMVNMCGWVLTFSAVSALTNELIPSTGLKLFLQTVCEVTNGCEICIRERFSLPVISAVLGFGGLAVTAQICPYLEECGVKTKTFLCWRSVTAALSAFFCSQFIRIFPREQAVFSATAPVHVSSVSCSLIPSIIMVLMCILFIFEVDNRRKLC